MTAHSARGGAARRFTLGAACWTLAALPAAAQPLGSFDGLVRPRAGRVAHYASTDPRRANDDFRPIALGRAPMRAGDNTVTLEIVGKDARARGYSGGYLVGVDGFALRR